ncbi:MAG: LCP family protein [Clostridia bacterium]|nr:LCP family protein [Clostridia bacterium]
MNSNKNMQNQFEDIISDSRYMRKGKKRYRKKKHGIVGFFQKIGYKISDWWYNLSRNSKRAIISLSSVVVVIALLFGIFRIVFDYNYNNIGKNPDDLGFKNIIDSKIVNVALFGIDSRDPKSFTGLSDSIMIMSINTETKVIKLVSVMRDSLVPIEKNGKRTYGKINSAYKSGGPQLAVKTLNTIFGLDISEYATVNFYGMSDIIDAVGGIDATITKPELVTPMYGINGMISEQCEYLGVDPKPYFLTQIGTQHLNGIQAVAYARIRHAANADGVNDDYGRTDRQRYVMEQLFNKALTLNNKNYVKLAKALIPCSETSLSYSEIMGLAMDVLLKSPKFEQTRIPLVEYQMSSKNLSGIGSCVYYDLDYAAKILHAFIYNNISPEDYMAQNGIEKNDWYSGGNSGKGNGNTSSSVAKEPTGKDNSSEITSSEDSSSDTNSDIVQNEEPIDEPTVSDEPASEPDDTSQPNDTGNDTGNDTSSTNSTDSGTTE